MKCLTYSVIFLNTWMTFACLYRLDIVLGKSPNVNTDLRQNLAEIKVAILKQHLNLRPGLLIDPL